jgi:hypothetical protein
MKFFFILQGVAVPIVAFFGILGKYHEKNYTYNDFIFI